SAAVDVVPGLPIQVAEHDPAELADQYQAAVVEDRHVVPGHVFFFAQALPGHAIVPADQQRAHLATGDGQAIGADTYAIELVGDLGARDVAGPLPAGA